MVENTLVYQNFDKIHDKMLTMDGLDDDEEADEKKRQKQY